MEHLQALAALPRYESYKDSGVDWIGEVPDGWEVRKLKHFASVFNSNVDKHTRPNQRQVRLCNYVNVYKSDVIDSSIDFMISSASEEEIAKFRLKTNDVILTKDSEDWRDIGEPALVLFEADDFICGYHLTIVRASTALFGQYFFYLAKSTKVKAQLGLNANGVTRYGLPISSIKNQLLPLPPLPEQRAIASFLDEKTALIDRLIAQKERMLSLLKERRQIVIQQAVTRGLDPNVKLKPSGVDWLGDVPEGWEVKRLKNSSQILTGFPFESKMYSEEGIKLARGINVKEGRFDWTELRFWPKVNSELQRYVIRDGDILIAMDGSKVGKNFCLVEEKDLPILLLQRVARVRVNNELYPSFLYWNIASGNFLFWVNMRKTDPMVPHISPADIKEYVVALPPLSEQLRIVAHIEVGVGQIDRSLVLLHNQINTLKEYRSVLIDSVVRGKVRVHGDVR